MQLLLVLLCCQVIRSHLTGLRRALIADREAHATAMKHYQKKLELEKLKQQLLKDAGKWPVFVETWVDVAGKPECEAF